MEPEVVTPEVVTPAGPDRPLAQGRILYGDASRFDHPAVIRLDDVIRAIAAYRKISSGSVQVDSAEYLILASRGTRVLRSAVRIAAKHYGFDLVGERGQVWLPGGTPIPDITRQVSAVVRQMRLAE